MGKEELSVSGFYSLVLSSNLANRRSSERISFVVPHYIYLATFSHLVFDLVVQVKCKHSELKF